MLTLPLYDLLSVLSLWLPWVFVARRWLSPVGVSGDQLLVVRRRLLTVVASLVGEHRLHAPKLSTVVLGVSTVVLRLSTVLLRLSTVVLRLSTVVLGLSTVVLRLSTVVLGLSTMVLRLSTVVLRLSTLVPGLSCSTACGVSPDQGSNPCPLHWQVILTRCSPGKSLVYDFPRQNHFRDLPTPCLMHMSHG